MADFVELTIDAGADFSTVITVGDSNGNGKNLVSYTARSQLRKSYYSLTAVDFTVVIVEPENGIIRMDLSAAATANIRAGRYVYDVEIENLETGSISRIFEGIVTVLPNVTRSAS